MLIIRETFDETVIFVTIEYSFIFQSTDELYRLMEWNHLEY